jgi:mono/diheme cytochrome c family protein
VRSAAGLILILFVAACSKQEPPAKPAAQPASNVGAELAPPSTPAAPPAAQGGTSSAPTPATGPTADLLKQGEQIFAATCATCHMADGSGVPFLQPSIKGSAWISNPDPQLLLSLILRGSTVLGEAAQAYENDMAPQEHLTDAEVAAVATYVRTRFAAVPVEKPVTLAEVAIARQRPGLPK